MRSFRDGRVSLVAVAGGCLALILWHADRLGAAAAELLESSYTVHARGIKVGELRTVCSVVPDNGKKLLKFEAKTSIHANLLVYSFDMDSQEEALVGDEGTIRYRRSTREKDKVSDV